jgi:hypothetical protein
MTTYYILIENQNDPRHEKIVGVYGNYRWKAEEAKLNFQQDKAASFNVSRQECYDKGHGFAAKKTADDFETYYTIKQVHQHE